MEGKYAHLGFLVQDQGRHRNVNHLCAHAHRNTQFSSKRTSPQRKEQNAEPKKPQLSPLWYIWREGSSSFHFWRTSVIGTVELWNEAT